MSRQRSVKRIFSFSSGTLNKLGIWGAVIGSARDRSARLLDLGARGGGHCHALHAELAPHVTHAEQLDRVIRPAHQPRPEQRVGRHLHTLGELIQVARSEEHTSELQSRLHLVCRLLLEKKKTKYHYDHTPRSATHNRT